MTQKTELSTDKARVEEVKAKFFDLFLGKTRFYERFTKEADVRGSGSTETDPPGTQSSSGRPMSEKPAPIQLTRNMRLRNIELLEPTRLGKSAIDWIGRDVVLGRHVLLRFFAKKTQAAPYLKLSRFKARALPTLFDVVPCCGRQVLVLEWPADSAVPMRLDSRMVQELSFWKRLGIVRELARALALLHEKGEAHGSVHPSHLFWFDGPQRVLMLGFGEAPADDPTDPLPTKPDAKPMARDIQGLGAIIIRLLPPFVSIGERCMQENHMLRPSAESLALFFRLYEERHHSRGTGLLETVGNLSLNPGESNA